MSDILPLGFGINNTAGRDGLLMFRIKSSHSGVSACQLYTLPWTSLIMFTPLCLLPSAAITGIIASYNCTLSINYHPRSQPYTARPCQVRRHLPHHCSSFNHQKRSSAVQRSGQHHPNRDHVLLPSTPSRVPSKRIREHIADIYS